MADTLILTTRLTRRDSVKVFLYGYYSRPGWKWVRILAAPVLVAVGVILLGLGHRFTTIYGGICIGYACYYAVRPLLLLVPRLKGMNDLAATYQIVPGGGLKFSDGKTETLIPARAVQDVRLGTHYLTIEIKTKRRYFFHVPLACLISGDAAAFCQRLLQETEE